MKKGSHLTDEQKAKISAGSKGKHSGEKNEMFGKHHTDETKRKMSESRSGKRNPNFGKHFTAEHRKKLSESAKLRVGEKNAFYGKKHTLAAKEKIGAASRERFKDPEYKARVSSKGMNTGKDNPMADPVNRAKVSKALKRKYTGENHWMYGKPAYSKGHGKGSYFTRSNGEKIWLRSSYETRVATVLDTQNIPFDYEPKAFPLNGTGTTYRPDFYLSDQKIWLEVKGYMSDLARKKIELFREQYPEEKLIILYGEDIKRLEEVQSFVGGSVE
jgi:hypothetical protein